MANVAVHPGVQDGNKLQEVGALLEPAGGVPQGWLSLEAWTHWIKELFASLGDLLLPEILEDRIIVVPSLAKNATYEVFNSFVYNELATRLDLSERNIAQLGDHNPQGLEDELSRMGGILKMVAQAGDWITAHKAEFGRKGIEAVQINQTLLSSQRLVGQILQRLPDTGDLLQPAPRDWLPKALVSPGLSNPIGNNDCFMNAFLQIIFGDPLAYRWIALNPHQHEHIKLAAFNFRYACSQRQTSSLALAQGIRNLSDQVRGRRQWDIDEAFRVLVHHLSGKEKESHGSEDEYRERNPFVHKMINKKTYGDLERDLLDPQELPQLEGNTRIKHDYTWNISLSFQNNPESDAIESLFESALRPSVDASTLEDRKFKFRLKTGETKEYVRSAEAHIFERRPEQLFLSISRLGNDGTRAFAITNPIELKNFYLDPKHVATEEGGEYEIRAFGCHDGKVNPSGDSFGHYICYRKVGNEWYYFSDTTVRKVNIDEVERIFRTKCTVILAGRVESDKTNEDIIQGVQENVEAAKTAQLEREIASAKAPLPKGDTIDVKEKHLERIKLFRDFLNKDEPPKPQLLVDIFKGTPPEFQAFCKQMLILEEKMVDEDDVHAHLLKLKDIMTQYLTTELNEHIVTQYYYIRQKQLEMIRNELQATAIKADFLRHLNHAQAESISLEGSITSAEFRSASFKTLLARLADTDEQVVRGMGEILMPGLTHVIETVQEPLEDEDPLTLQQVFQKLHEFNQNLGRHFAYQQSLNDISSKE